MFKSGEKTIECYSWIVFLGVVKGKKCHEGEKRVEIFNKNHKINVKKRNLEMSKVA